MQEIEHSFYSDGLRLDAVVYQPDDLHRGARRPLMIACSGFTGLHRIHPARFARWLTSKGYVCFSFDYRGFGRSEGPRCRPILEEQVRDVRCAVSVARRLKVVDPENVFLLGWAMGGGVVIEAARELGGLRGICSLNGLYDGPDFQEYHRGPDGVDELRNRIEDERYRRARSGIVEYVAPFDVYPLDEVTRAYVEGSLELVDGYEDAVCSFELAESLMRWSVPARAAEVELPIFVAHGDRNELHPPRQVEALERAWNGPVETLWLKDAGHTEWMSDENPIFQDLCGQLYAWLEANRAPGSTP